VNTPGQMHTPMVEVRLAKQRAGGDVEALLKERVSRIPLGFMGDGRDTAYAALAQHVAAATRRSYEAGNGSPPSAIANVISKAITAKRPKTRYVAGKYARSLITMRRLVGDRMFDRIILKAMSR